jgi:hypothetical protein
VPAERVESHGAADDGRIITHCVVLSVRVLLVVHYYHESTYWPERTWTPRGR